MRKIPMGSPLSMGSIIVLLVAGTLLANIVVAPLFAPRCPAGFQQAEGYEGVCFHPLGGDFHFQVESLIDGQKAFERGDSLPVEVERGCPQDEPWWRETLTGVEICMKASFPKFDLVSDLMNATTSSQIQIQSVVPSIVSTAPFRVEFNGPHYPAMAGLNVPEMQSPTTGMVMGSVDYLLIFWGQGFVALNVSGDTVFVPVSQFGEYEHPENTIWPDGTQVFLYKGGGAFQSGNIEQGLVTFEPRG